MTTNEIYTNYNTAEPSTYSLIPAGTIARASIFVRIGNYGDDNLLTKNERTGSVGLNLEFTITDGQFKGRKIFQLVGIEGTKRDEQGNDMWGAMGRKLIRSILESARNVRSDDDSDKAEQARKIKSLGELNGLECLIKIGIEKDKTEQYEDKNKVLTAITMEHKEYANHPSIMSGSLSGKVAI